MRGYKNIEGFLGTERDYLSKGLLFSLAAGTIACFAAAVLGQGLLQVLGFSVLAFSACLAAWAYYPKARKKRKAASIEKDLPFALLEAGTSIEVGQSFEKVLEGIASQENPLGREMGKVLKEVREYNASMEEALRGFSQRIDSLDVKRAVAQLTGVYEQGGRKGKGKGVKEIGLELLEKQHAVHKEYNQKLVLYGLVFVVVSAIVPALFQAMTLVGASFLEMNYSSLKAFLVPAVLFPAVDMIVLAFIRWKTPLFLK